MRTGQRAIQIFQQSVKATLSSGAEGKVPQQKGIQHGCAKNATPAIQNTTGRGASFISASNISLKNINFTNASTSDLDADNSGLSTGDNLVTNASIHLQSVTTVTLDNLNISGGAEQGINGNAVSGFSLLNSSIVDAGNGPDEDGIHFYNM